MTLPQARGLASAAVQDDPALALRLARGLLLADKGDAVAHYISAAAQARLGRPTEARKSAARAYRFANAQADRYRAAQLAARLAYDEDRPTLAQIWLRRTAIHAPDDRQKALIARDYRALRQQAPWSFGLRTTVKPSDNVNNGPETAEILIDGIGGNGNTAPGALALSGTIGAVDLSARYRLRATAENATHLAARLYHRRVWLSSEARAIAPDAENGDYASTYSELSLRHAFSAGPSGGGGSAALTATLGGTRYGGNHNYMFAKLRGDRRWNLSAASDLRLNATAERRFDARATENDARILGLGATLGHRFDSGASVQVTLSMRDSSAVNDNGTYRGASLQARYGFARPLGPARVTATIGAGLVDYPSYLFSTTLGRRPRQDNSAFAELSLFFSEFDYAGFAPTLSVRSSQNRSNFSRFTTDELSVTIGIGSNF